jgi:hypothetical protein
MAKLRTTVTIACVALISAGCGDDTGQAAGGSGGSSSDGGGGAESTSSGAGGSGGSGGSAGPGFADGGGDTGGGSATGCTKVDFLFVVDNSVSMENEQDALVASFPAFMETIQNTVAASSDYHILVADTDAWGRCNTANPWTGITPNHETCNDYIEMTVFEECDRVRGAGVVHPAGEFASNMECEVFGGNRYIVEGDPNAAETFACMAKVGTAGHSSERPMEGIVGALSPELNADDGCNAGFVRDDAILVITFISDDPNVEDTGTPQSWYDAVVAAKGGNADSVVVLGLTPYSGGTAGQHWHDFIGLWGEKGLEASVTLPDYSPFFEEAVGLIEEACEDFTPE